MKSFYFFLFFLFIYEENFSQNLVLNPGFENFSTCPVGFSQFNGYIQNWVSPNTASPDCYNTCANPNPAGVPVNGNGYQPAHSGNGYAGIYTTPGSYREFIQVALSSTLIAEYKYTFSMYVNLHNKSDDATDDIGAYISATAPSSTDNGFLNGNPSPQINNPSGNVITDTMNWTLITGQYTATGGEKFITIGHFHDDAHTTYQTVNTGSHLQGSYYYIDDVSLVNSGALPVELISFSGEQSENNIQLEWITKSEINNEGFELLRSCNGKEFDEVAWINGNGTSSLIHEYSYTDLKEDNCEMVYYKLLQVDFDGHSEYSNVIAIRLKQTNNFFLTVSENSESGKLKIIFNLPESDILKISLVNVYGQEIYILKDGLQSKGRGQLEFDNNSFSSLGIYFIDAVYRDERKFLKIIL